MAGGSAGRHLGWAVLPLGVVLAVLFLWPVAQLLGLSFDSPAGPLGHYARILAVPAYRTALATTFQIAALVTLLAVLLAYPLAYLMATVPPRVAKLLTLCVLLPFWTSALVRTTAWIILLQRNGVLNALLTGSGLLEAPVAFVYNLSGVLIGMSHVLMPFVVLPLYGAFRGIDQNLVHAAETLGAGPWALCRRIFLPLTAPGVMAGATIVFMNALGYYITPSLMGGPAQTMVAQLIAFNINQQLDWGLAGALSLAMLLATLAVFFLFQAVFGLERLMGGAHASGRIGTPFALGPRGRSPGGRVMALLGAGVALFLIAPVLVVFPMSLGSSPFLAFPPQNFSLRWYEEFFSRPQWMASVWNSLTVAGIAVAGSTLLGTAAALGLSRLRGPLARLVETAFLLPMIVPHIILAIGLFGMMAPWGLVRGPWALGLAHIVVAAPFVVITVRAALRGVDPNLELAALGLGAGWFTMFRRVLLPGILPGIASGAVFAFITSFDDVVLALFLTNVRSRTLPKLMYEGVAHEINPTITAVAALIVLFTVLVLLLNLLLQRRAR
ncbi:ABC transporter permease subunit [Roseomonas sp. GC11]|uniref:ABC transporter permease n=1 Tax=Roseomonas sp. GC11 TaxID=2950546 RepID=UPI00210C4FE6|nr:ABC transporter permease subunit [Roseomonas sp. GC11]MCQ4159334.1 ABC transporter permease subunit [Roseomonas sp. GC11]